MTEISFRPAKTFLLVAAIVLLAAGVSFGGYGDPTAPGNGAYREPDQMTGTEQVDEDTLREMAEAVQQMDAILQKMTSAMGRITTRAKAADMANMMTQMSTAMRDMSLQLQSGRIDPLRMKNLHDSLDGMTMWADSL